MPKKGALLTLTIYASSLSFAWSYDVPAFIEDPIIALVGVLWPAVLIILVVNLIRQLIIWPREPVLTSYSVPQTTSYVAPAFQAGYSQNSWISETLYHGTPNYENAFDITDPNSGFIIGGRNSYGTGLYLADFQSAKTYAKGTGAILIIGLEIPGNQVADYASVINSPFFKQWRPIGNGDFGDKVTDYTLTFLRKRFIKVSPGPYVALSRRTNGIERVAFEGLTILGVLDAQGNPIQGG